MSVVRSRPVTPLPPVVQVPPPPKSHGDLLRWEHTRKRRRLLYSEHRADVEQAVQLAVGTVRRAAWGVIDLSANPYLSLWEQTSRLYAARPQVAGDADTIAAVEAAGLWSLMQRVQRDTLGLREMGVRVEVVDGKPVYTPIPPDLLEAECDPAEPGQAIRITETRWHGGRWVRVTWDAEARTVRATDKDGTDVTEEVVGLGLDGDAYPYVVDGRAVVPIVLYHAAETSRLWDPWTGCELVEGSLQICVLLTFFGHVVRQAAWSQRYAVGVEVMGAGSESIDGAQGARAEIVTDPATLLLLAASEGAQPLVGQWAPPMSATEVIRAIQAYEERLVESAGLRLDVTRQSSDIRSGYSLAVARDAIRESQAGYAPLFERSDLRLLRVTAAALGRPTDGAWAIHYQGLPQSPVERRAIVDEVIALRGAGLMSRVEAFLKLHPAATEEQAIAALAAIDAERA